MMLISSIFLSFLLLITTYLAASQDVNLPLSQACSSLGKSRVCRSCLPATQCQLPSVILHQEEKTVNNERTHRGGKAHQNKLD